MPGDVGATEDPKGLVIDLETPDTQAPARNYSLRDACVYQLTQRLWNLLTDPFGVVDLTSTSPNIFNLVCFQGDPSQTPRAEIGGGRATLPSLLALGARAYALLAAVLALSLGCVEQPNPPNVALGRIDLSRWNFEESGTVGLVGQWSTCWDELVAPGSIDCPSGPAGAWTTAPVPGLWSEDAVPSPFGGRGVATYRLTIALPEDGKAVFLRAGAALTAYRVWVDGESRGGAGTVGATAATTRAELRNRVIALPHTGEPVELSVEIANFAFRGGGLRRPWLVGTSAQIQAWTGRTLLREALLAIIATVVGLAYVVQFALRPAERDRGYFGLFALTIGLRAVPASISDLSTLLTPWASFGQLLRLEYLGTAIAIFAGTGYLRTKVENVMPPRLAWLCQLTALALAAIVIAAPLSWVQATMAIQLTLPAIVLLMATASYSRALRRGREGAGWVLLSCAAYLIAVGHDVTRVQTGIGLAIELYPYFFVLWLSVEAGSMLQSFFRSFSNIEDLSNQLLESNFELQENESAVVRFVPFDLLRLIGKKSIREVSSGDRRQGRMTVLYCAVHVDGGGAAASRAELAFEVINRQLQWIAPALQHAGGFITQQAVDAIVAVFPERPDDAVRAAIDLFEERRRLDPARDAQSGSSGASSRIGIGIASGPVTIGTYGSPQHLGSGVIGEPVELARRLEELTEAAGVEVLISDATREELDPGASWRLREVDSRGLSDSSDPSGSSKVFELLEVRGDV